jgi:hypothetical protein
LIKFLLILLYFLFLDALALWTCRILVGVYFEFFILMKYIPSFFFSIIGTYFEYKITLLKFCATLIMVEKNFEKICFYHV